MSKGKKWKMPTKYFHKRPFRWRICRIGGGKNGKFRFKYFRHKKKFQCIMNGKISMKRMVSIEKWYWD